MSRPNERGLNGRCSSYSDEGSGECCKLLISGVQDGETVIPGAKVFYAFNNTRCAFSRLPGKRISEYSRLIVGTDDTILA